MKQEVYIQRHKSLILGKKYISYHICSTKTPYKNNIRYVTLEYVNNLWNIWYHNDRISSGPNVKNKDIPWKEIKSEIKKIIKELNNKANITDIEFVGKELIKE